MSVQQAALNGITLLKRLVAGGQAGSDITCVLNDLVRSVAEEDAEIADAYEAAFEHEETHETYAIISLWEYGPKQRPGENWSDYQVRHIRTMCEYFINDCEDIHILAHIRSFNLTSEANDAPA